MHINSAAIVLGLLPCLSAASLVRREVDCEYSLFGQDGDTCQSLSAAWVISEDKFKSLNPGVDCSAPLIKGKEYCVAGSATDPPVTDQPTSTKTTLITSTTTASDPHTPTQTGLAKNCDKFHKIVAGDQCDVVEAKYDISHDQFLTWNPAINKECTNLLRDYYVCVHVPGAVKPTVTTTKAPEQTCYVKPPENVQPGAVCGCDKWHIVSEGTTCQAIIDYEKINADDFYKWNPKIGGAACTGIWKNYNVCVHGPGATKPTPTTTKKPEPTCYKNEPKNVQPGALCGCSKWHVVSDGTTCDAIISYDKINANDFYRWNPKVGGKACTGLWKGYSVCVLGPNPSKPTTTTKKPEPTCHPKAPTPVQPGAVCNCKKWHLVKDASTTCAAIIKNEKITAANFYKWNPKVGGTKCTGLWKGYYVCVGV